MSIHITGGRKISGSVWVQGSKNSALPILAACLLTDGKVTLHGVPQITDVENQLAILRRLGCAVTRQGHTLSVSAENRRFAPICDLAKNTRGATLFMGAKLSAFHSAGVYGGGGCNLGSRPLNYHTAGFEALGAVCDGSRLFCKTLRGGHIALPFPSVGATQNCLLASVCAEGDTVILGAAREPEVCDLIKFLCLCGAKITGMGTSTLKITGVQRLHGCSYTVMTDRCAAITYLLAGAVTGGSIHLSNVSPFTLYNVIPTLMQMGLCLSLRCDSITLTGSALRGLVLKTGVHPGFPTDLQPMVTAALAMAGGQSTVQDPVFQNRFAYVQGLRAMGAGAVLSAPDTLHLKGNAAYTGAEVTAPDLRGGAALVLAGLAAGGDTAVLQSHRIARGYESFAKTLAELGANIKEDEKD